MAAKFSTLGSRYGSDALPVIFYSSFTNFKCFQSERLLASGKVDITPIISHEFSLADYDKAHQTLIKGEGIKILVKPNAS